MFIIGNKRLEIVEKDRLSVRKGVLRLKDSPNPKNGTLHFSALKLHFATARCILSRDLTNMDLLFEASSSFLRYQTIINTSKNELTFKKENISLLRDFSRKARIGELAQGITYLLTQEHLKYPIVVDFEGFVKRHNPNAVITGKTPDFIAQNEKTDYNYTIVESKGHYAKSNSTKGALRQALEQCENGEKIVTSQLGGYTMNKSYGVCVKFENQHSSKNSEIQFVDPSKIERNDNYNLDLVRYHYASWFLLMGDYHIYEKLLDRKNLVESDLKNSRRGQLFGKEYTLWEINGYEHEYSSVLRKTWIPDFGIDGYGIRRDVIEILMGHSQELVYDYSRNTKENDNGMETFCDGTMLLVKKLR